MTTTSYEFDTAYQKGFLENDLELFYICSDSMIDYKYHYHDFYKLLIHIQGAVTYHIEGADYALRPYDTLLISPGEIHKPDITKPSTYERIIAYISESFFETLKTYDTFSFKKCFEDAKETKSHVVRFSSPITAFKRIIDAIKSCYTSHLCGNELLKRIKLQEYLLLLNQNLQTDSHTLVVPTNANDRVCQVIKYINENIHTDLSISQIAETLYLHPSYLMHLFKKETGYTIGKYISEKRLFAANQLIADGKSITEACYLSGYQNYGTFYHAYKARYGTSPKGRKLV